jgi:hypothetical protein
MPREWETYYFMLGSSSAGLIGLLFVVVSLTTNTSSPQSEIGSRTYVTPTVFHFGEVFVIGATVVMPGLPLPAVSLAVGLLAFLGFVYASAIVWRMARRGVSVPHWTDYVFYGAFPGAVYLWLMAAAVGLWAGSLFGLYGLAVGALALLLIGIRDAWDLAVWLIYQRKT